jgi:large conductance mechanosensitive channel
MSFAEAKGAFGGVATRGLSLWDEFKAFAFKGNVVDLAVGVIIGAAFGKIVDSLVRNVIMPIVSYVTPSMDFSEWKVGRLLVGNLLNDVLSFLITAVAIYLFIVKFLGWVMKNRKTEPAAKPEVTLLTEIRDILKERPAT